MRFSGAARVAGVIGWPIGHSLSPRLHNFWLRQYDLNGAYVPLAVRPFDLSTVLNGLGLAGFAGVNVTAPHKGAAFALADLWDAAAESAKAANLLLFREGRIEARNSDVGGLAASVREEIGFDAIVGGFVTILGAGGAARAAVLACYELGAGEILILNRTAKHASALVESLANSVSCKLHCGVLQEWSEFAPATRLLVNATSAGAGGTPSPVTALEGLMQDAAVCDLVYHPVETPLLALARRLGLRTVDGLSMLMHQAAPAFESFYGVRPQISSALRTYLLQSPNDAQ